MWINSMHYIYLEHGWNVTAANAGEPRLRPELCWVSNKLILMKKKIFSDNLKVFWIIRVLIKLVVIKKKLAAILKKVLLKHFKIVH